MARIVIPNAPPRRAKHNSDRANPAEVLGIEDTGASKRGNTYWKTMRGCPRESALRNIVGLRRGGDSEALTVGLTFHHALEVYYRAIMRHQASFTGPTHQEALGFHDFLWGGLAEAEQAAWESIAPMKGVEGYEATYDEIERMLAGYFDQYRRKDRWRIIAVEETLEYDDEAMEYSARLDLIVECFDRGGMWVIEHKSARAISEDLLAGYQLDQQIVGQVWLLRACVDLTAYPPLRGVLVNITTKHKSGPRFERVECMPSKHHLSAFETSLSAWHAIVPVFEELGWPQALGNCAGPSRYWSRCDYYDLCYGKPDVTVAQLVKEDPPMGFTRDEVK